MGDHGLKILQERVHDLDEPAGIDVGGGLIHPDVARFIATMRRVTRSPRVDHVLMPRAAPEKADMVLAESALLGRLLHAAPELVCGPLTGAQYWVRTEPRAGQPPREIHLDPSTFVAPQGIDAIPPTTKPFHVGLFTSTGSLEPFGMWRAYLELSRGSPLFPRPWHVWSLTPLDSARIFEIDSASAWANLVTTYPAKHRGLLYPDWKAIADDFDALHMTLRAIGASQGICLDVEGGVVAAPYWDVESTLWLRQCFADGGTLVETVG